MNKTVRTGLSYGVKTHCVGSRMNPGRDLYKMDI